MKSCIPSPLNQTIRTFLLFGIALFFSFQLYGQAPDAVNYQAVVRDAGGTVLPNQAVSFQLSVLETSAAGTAVYTEQHNVTTNDFGLANLVLGQGSAVLGTFSSIDWGNDAHFLQVELDENGGTNYQTMGTTELVSVPYALHARTVEIDMVDDADADSTNELQTVTQSGNTVTLSHSGGSFTIDDADADPNNEIQTLSKSGLTISLSNGGGSVQDSVNDADADPLNETNQSLTLSNDSLLLTDANGTLSTDLSGLIGDDDWTRNGNYLYNLTDTFGIGASTNNSYNAHLQIGFWGNFSTWTQDSLPNNVWIGGGVNSPAQQDVVKLMIGGYDNDGSTVYPIVAKDENGNTDFYLLNRPTSGGDPRAYFAGDFGIGTENPTGKLSVNGDIRVLNNNNDNRVRLLTDGGVGEVRTWGNNGQLNSRTTHWGTGSDYGVTAYYDANGNDRYIGGVSTSGAGLLVVDGPNGNLNANITFLSGTENHGFIGAYDNGGNVEAGVYVDASGQGIVFGDVKNFRMEHPTQQGKEIWYASLEGPEAGAYDRGTAHLQNGTATIQFSNHFQHVANHTTLTVVVTPLDGSSKGLAVIEKTAQGFKVVELLNGTGTYDFDWEVKAVRKGHENYRVIRDASECQAGGTNAQLAPITEEAERKAHTPSTDAVDDADLLELK
ncbi:MAG: hypothetical protein AAF570_03035 [Bacteroidota bacterium]